MRSHEIQRDVMSVGVHVATNDTKDKLARFLRALYGTEIFKNPDYVTCPGWLDNQTDLLNAITSLEPLNGASPDFRKLSQIQLWMQALYIERKYIWCWIWVLFRYSNKLV